VALGLDPYRAGRLEYRGPQLHAVGLTKGVSLDVQFVLTAPTMTYDEYCVLWHWQLHTTTVWAPYHVLITVR